MSYFFCMLMNLPILQSLKNIKLVGKLNFCVADVLTCSKTYFLCQQRFFHQKYHRFIYKVRTPNLVSSYTKVEVLQESEVSCYFSKLPCFGVTIEVLMAYVVLIQELNLYEILFPIVITNAFLLQLIYGKKYNLRAANRESTTQKVQTYITDHLLDKLPHHGQWVNTQLKYSKLK